MLIKIINNNKVWNWEAYDKLKIPIYGKTFKTKREAKEDWKIFAKSNSIKKWYYDNLLTKVWRVICQKVR